MKGILFTNPVDGSIGTGSFHAKKIGLDPEKWYEKAHESMQETGEIDISLFVKVKRIPKKKINRFKKTVNSKKLERSKELRKKVEGWKDRQIKEKPPVFVPLKEYRRLSGMV